ncbi:hypothetical protein ACFQ0T_38745 [Kitasatospora gansuensis]
MPPPDSPDYLATVVAAAVLGDGESSGCAARWSANAGWPPR